MGEESKCVKLYFTSVASTSSVRNPFSIEIGFETSVSSDSSVSCRTVTSKYGNNDAFACFGDEF